MSAGTHYDRFIGWSINQCRCLYLTTVGPGSPSWAPSGSPSDVLQQKVFFLAATAIEFTSLLGYGRFQYTGNWTNVINTKDVLFGKLSSECARDLLLASCPVLLL